MDGYLKAQLFKFSASRHQQDRGILLETKAKAPRFEAEAKAVKIAPRGEAMPPGTTSLPAGRLLLLSARLPSLANHWALLPFGW